jgi:hypothetical protein
MKKHIYFLAFIVVGLVSACSLDTKPYDSLTADLLIEDKQGIESLVNGNLMMMKENLAYAEGQYPDARDRYERHLFQMTEYPSDNLLIVKSTTDNLWYSFNMEHIPGQLNTTYFWFMGYKIILNSSIVIENVEITEETPDDVKHLVGECYFYRAMVHFDLARIFSRPPSHGLDNPGIVLRLSEDEEDDKARASVGETYEQILNDLETAYSLMTQRYPGNQSESLKYASKWAAQALKIRALLYTEDWNGVITEGEKLLNEAPHRLADRDEYLNAFWNVTTSPEAIFAIYITSAEEHGKSSLGSMYNGGPTGSEGWGEVFPSKPFQNLLATYKQDVRNGLIDTFYNDDGNIKKYPATPYETFYINKFSNQDGIAANGSPQYLRLSEVYLNIAEAYAHSGNDQKALEYVNEIRTRAGIPADGLITTSNLGNFGYGNVLDAVLGEKRMEMCYEGLRRDDLLRNKRDLDRSFPSAQNPDNSTDILPWDAPRQIYFIPQAEILNNKLCEQNP